MTEHFSQHGEEGIILQYLPNALTKVGRYVDIGGGAATENSNTYLFYQHGWEGLVVEPYERMWLEHLSVRPRDICLKKSISNKIGTDEHLDTATVGSPIGDIYKFKECMIRPQTGKPHDHFFADCTTMDQLIQDYPEFAEPDFISIDIDTNEDKLLEKCDFTKFRPKLIVIEYMVRGVDYRPIWGHKITPWYDERELFSGNAFYTRKPNT